MHFGPIRIRELEMMIYYSMKRVGVAELIRVKAISQEILGEVHHYAVEESGGVDIAMSLRHKAITITKIIVNWAE